MNDTKFHYDKDRAERAVAFIENLKIIKGKNAGKNVELLEWQRDFVTTLFGWVDDDGNRQYKRVYLEIAKKNSKSTMGAWIALYMLFADGEYGAEVFSAAADRHQAGIVFDIALANMKQSPALARRGKPKPSTKEIVYPDMNGIYRVLSSDVKNKHGYDVSCALIDELHAHHDRKLLDVLTVGASAARPQPLHIIMTTAGNDFNSACWQEHEYAEKVLSGTITNDRYLAVIYAMDKDDDWEDERNWHKANPSLGTILSMDDLRQEYQQARLNGSLQSFRQLRLNQWVSSQEKWLDVNEWDKRAEDFTEDEFEGCECYGGLDLSAISDLTSWTLLFPDADNPQHVYIVQRTWCTRAWVDDSKNQYGELYRQWERDGWLTVTDGNAIDYSIVRKQVIADAEKFHIIGMNIDKLFQGAQVSMEIAEEIQNTVSRECVVSPMGMGFASFAAPMVEFARRYHSGQIHHDGNPITRFAIDSTRVKCDPNGNMKPDKATSSGKIDPLVTMVMAIDVAMRHEEPKDEYVVHEGGLLSV
jgi:phage terminase large subunit-like protein